MNSSSLYKATLKARSIGTGIFSDSAGSRYGSSSGNNPSNSQSIDKSFDRQPTRVCICSKTKHPGSFRCRYHRAEEARLRASSSRVQVEGGAYPLPDQLLKPLAPTSPSAPSQAASSSRRRGQLGPSRLSRVTTAAMYADDDVATNDGSPFRFLKFAAAAGAAAVAASGAAMQWRKTHGGAPDDLLSKLGPDAPPAAAASTLNQQAYYEVEPGETLTNIARKLGTTVEVLRESNGLKSDMIQPGQQLWVPKTHTIQKGDTLSKIARDYGTSVNDLLKLNSINNPDKIYPGDILLLP